MHYPDEEKTQPMIPPLWWQDDTTDDSCLGFGEQPNQTENDPEPPEL